MRMRVTVDTREVDRELDRLQHAPDARTVLALEAVFAAVYQETVAMVHVDTGSLRNSGEPFSVEHHGEWEGEFKFGGSSPGAVHNPVVYAMYEMERGGVHDFMAAARQANQGYIDAMMAQLRGTL